MENHVTICGTVETEPELRESANGVPRLWLKVRQERKWRKRDGSTGKHINVLQVTTYDDLATRAGTSLGIGDRVIVMGRMEHRQWVDPDGREKHSIELAAHDIGLSFRQHTIN